MAGGNIWAISKRQDCVAGSSAHAEIIAASAVANEVTWTCGLADEIHHPQLSPVHLNMDNSAVYSLSRDFASCSKTRHIPRRQFAVREKQHKKIVNTVKVDTSDNYADMFTKVLTRVPFERFTKFLLNMAHVGATAVRPRNSAIGSSSADR